MGRFIYGGEVRADFEDRALSHLQATITAKLRRGEPLTLTWREDVSIGGGRTTVWLHPAASLVYKYYGSRVPRLNRAWLEVLMQAANSPSGLYLVPEPGEVVVDDEEI